MEFGYNGQTTLFETESEWMTPEPDSTPTLPAPTGHDRLHLRAAGILERVADAFLVVDRQWRIVYANREACRINQKPLEEFRGRTHWEEWPAAVGTELERQFRRVMSEGVEAHFAHRYVSGPYDVWLEIDAYPAEDGIDLFYRDITERRRAEEALRESETRFRQMADAIPHIAWITAPGGDVEYYNRRWFDYSGLTLDETRGWGWERVIHPEDLERAGGAWLAAIRAGTVSETEYRLRRADGEYRWHLARSVPVREGDAVVAWIGTATDIESHRRAEEALRRSEERYRSLIDATAQIVWTNTPEGEMRGDQPGWGAYTGQAQAEYQGYGWAQAVHPDDAQATVAAWNEAVTTRRPFLFEHRVRRHDGVYRSFAIRAVAVLEEDGTIREWVGVHTDVTERRAAEAAREALLAQQGAFLRDVLSSVTEGKLLLSNGPAQLPKPLTLVGGPIPLTREGGLRDLRLWVQEAAGGAGHEEERRFDLMTAASEAGMNAIVHAGAGTAWVSAGENGTVQVRVEDHGGGISMENLPRATLARGFSTKATLGHGIKMMLETADRLSLLTGPAGTTVVLEQDRRRPLPFWLSEAIE